MRVLLVEPWYGGSHRAWVDGYRAASRHDVVLVTHDAAFWRWRLRGSAVTLAAGLEAAVAEHGAPDVVLVSGLTDLAVLRGMATRWLRNCAVALYLHESQLLHPPSPNGGHDPQYAWIQWQSMVAADHVYVSSTFHREALAGALPAFLAAVPDQPHGALLDAVLARTTVLSVGVDLDDLLGAPDARDPGHPAGPLVVWNQRWDHDKDPEALFRVLRALARDGVAFRVALAGENTRRDPQEFERTATALGERVVHCGWLDRTTYVELLGRADVVVSTARHEFFGIAAVEAMASGVVPLLPNRLSYPELVPERYHDAVLYRSKLYERLGAVLTDPGAARERVTGLRSAMVRWSWRTLAPVYDDALEALVAAHPVR